MTPPKTKTNPDPSPVDDVLASLGTLDLTGALPDGLRGMSANQLTGFVNVLDAHLKNLHTDEHGGLRDKTPEEKKAFDLGLTLRDQVMARIEEDRKVANIFKTKPASVVSVVNAIRSGYDDDAYGDTRRMSNAQARDAAMRQIDADRSATAHLSDEQKTHLSAQMRTDPNIARRILVTENDAYRNAWMKLVTDPDAHLTMDEDERTAIKAWKEFKNLSENTTTAGGFGIPVFIDPSIILTSQGSGNPFLTIARQVQVTTNQWKGVSSAGVSWTFQTEAAATSDASPTLAQPAVVVHMARGFLPYSIEVGDDYPSFAAEMSSLLAEGYDELLIEKFTRGTGSSEPYGILTCLSASASVRVTVTTVGTIGAPDPANVWKALPQRFRRNASWLMSVGVNEAIAQLGQANVYHAYTTTLSEGQVERLRNRPVYESPYMPDTTTSSTAPIGQAIVGDFSNFVIARAGGMNVELIANLVQQVTAGSGPAVPTGQRGWFAHARIGSRSVNDGAFRLLVNS